jgi:lactoylglutathione lyase
MTRARELLLQLVVDDYEPAVHLFRDVLDLEVVEEAELEEGGKGIFLSLPAVTLEIFDRRYGEMVDRVEVGRRVAAPMRVAVRVDSVAVASREIVGAGAEPLAPVVETPWRHRSQRFRTADGTQLSVFQETDV